MSPKYLFIILGFAGLWSSAIGQEDIESAFQSRLESYFEDEETDFLPVIEHLTHLSQNPLDLNRVSYEDLMQLGFLSPMQVEQILTHRAQLGDFLDVHELQAVSGLDMNTASLMSLVVRVDVARQWTPINFKNLWQFGKSELVIRAKTYLEEEVSYRQTDETERPYAGNNHQYVLRYRYNFDNRIMLSYLGEKDPGETLFKPKLSVGPDFNAVSLAILSPVKFVDMAIIGDFSVHLGQGLVSNGSYGGGKSGSVMQISKVSKPLRTYGSVNENGFFRGIALAGRIKSWNYMVFGSAKPFDASLETFSDSLDNLNTKIKSVQLTGFHRDSLELNSKQNVYLYSFGGKIGLTEKTFRMNLNFAGHRYQYPFTAPEDPYQKFRFTGRNLLNYSLDYSFRWKNMLFSGETAFLNLKAMANVHMVQMSLAKDLDLALLYRHYPGPYQAPFGEGFGESAGTSNEHGLYLASVLRINRQLRLEAYVDIWHHRWLKYLVDHPAYGYEYFLKMDYSIRKKMQLYIQFKSELKQRNKAGDHFTLNDIESIGKTAWRAHIEYKLSQTFELRNRVEWTMSSHLKKGFGLMIFQDLIYKPMTVPVSFTARLAYFDIKDWDSRIYAYENDLLYAFSIPAYYRTGFRVYGNVRYKPLRNLVVEARMARTFLPFEVLVDEGQFNHKTELKLQLKYSF